MQIQLIIPIISTSIIALTNPTFANLHNGAYCGNYKYKILGKLSSIHKLDAQTNLACEAYLNRLQGDEIWNSCPDCNIVRVYGKGYYYSICESKGGHIGGKQWDAYCKHLGAQHGFAWKVPEHKVGTTATSDTDSDSDNDTDSEP